jgi:hypothetical protein
MSGSKNNDTISQSASNGKTMLRATGADTSSIGNTTTADINNGGFKGGKMDLSRSITPGTVANGD